MGEVTMCENTTMNRRDIWAFDIDKDVLFTSIQSKIEFHTERVAHWRGKLEEALTSLREEGIVLESSIDPRRSTGYQHDGVSINPKHRQALSDAQAKVESHEDRLDTYKRFARALQYLEPESVLSCTIKDIEFFGL